MKNSNNVLIMSIILGIVLIGGFIFVGKQSKDEVLTLPVKVVEYSDFQCPACKIFHTVANEIKNIEGVEFTFKHFPLVSIHDRAYQAAVAAEAAREQGKFAEYHDILFENQPTQTVTDSFTDENFFKYAEEIGLDLEKFKADYEKQELKDRVDSDIADGKAFGINGTPTLIVNGERFTIVGKEDGQILDEIKALVEKAKANMVSEEAATPEVTPEGNVSPITSPEATVEQNVVE